MRRCKANFTPTNEIMRRYVIELSVAIFAYGIALVFTNLIYGNWEALLEESSWRFILAIIPMVPAAFAVRAMVRQLQRVDELEKLIQLKCLAIAFGATAFLSFTYGFLEGVGLPKLSMFSVWPVMAAFWVIARLLVGRRYA